MLVSVPGAQLFYSSCGQGVPLVVLSSVGTGPYERMMSERFSGDFQLIFTDLRGSGRSTGLPVEISFDRLAEDIEALREHLGLPKVTLLGHSSLGAIALEYGRRFPDSVRGVVTVGTPPFGDMARLSAASNAFFDADASEDRKKLLQENLARLTKEAGLGEIMLAHTPMRFFDPRVDAGLLFEGTSANPEFFKYLFGKLLPDWDITRGPESLRMPILLAHGRYDYTVPYILWEGIVEKLPDAELCLFHRSGHQPFLEEPERFLEALVTWGSATTP